MKIPELQRQTRDLRINRSCTAAQLVLVDGSFLHFRADQFSHWVQASPGQAQGLQADIAGFSLSRHALELTWAGGGAARIVRGSFRVRVEEAQ